MAQRKRAGLITRRTLDRNQVLLLFFFRFGCSSDSSGSDITIQEWQILLEQRTHSFQRQPTLHSAKSEKTSVIDTGPSRFRITASASSVSRKIPSNTSAPGIIDLERPTIYPLNTSVDPFRHLSTRIATPTAPLPSNIINPAHTDSQQAASTGGHSARLHNDCRCGESRTGDPTCRVPGPQLRPTADSAQPSAACRTSTAGLRTSRGDLGALRAALLVDVDTDWPSRIRSSIAPSPSHPDSTNSGIERADCRHEREWPSIC